MGAPYPVTPTITLYAGTPSTTTVAATGGVIDPLTITWGRARLTDQVQPASATVRIYYTRQAAVLRRDLLGTRMEIAGTNGDVRIGMFVGQVTYLAVEPGPAGGMIATLTAASIETAAGSVTVGQDSLNTRTVQQRAEELRNRWTVALPAALRPQNVRPPDKWKNALLAEVWDLTPADTVGEHLRRCYTGVGEDWQYDPELNSITSTSPAAGTDAWIKFTRDRDGLVRIRVSAAFGGIFGDYGATTLPACSLESTPVAAASLENVVPTSAAAWYGAPDADGNRPQKWALGANSLNTGRGGARVVVDSTFLSVTDAMTLAGDLAARAEKEFYHPAHPPCTWHVPGVGFPDSRSAWQFLKPAQDTRSVYLPGSLVADWAGVPPAASLIGGTITYQAGRWHITFNPAIASLTPAPTRNAVAWSDVDGTLTWQALDPTRYGYDAETGNQIADPWHSLDWLTTGQVVNYY